LLKNLFYKLLLPRLIKKACPARIPRSGKKGEGVNCYVVSLDQNEEPYFIATSIKGNIIGGLKWNNDSYSDEASILIDDIDKYNFIVTHYYGLSEIIYSSIYDIVWNYITRMAYIKLRFYKYIDSTFQYFFNKKKLVTKKRMNLLYFMIENQLDRDNDEISPLGLMSKVYSRRLFLHPSLGQHRKKIKLYLDSFVISGELEEKNGNYVVTGKAISTIEKYEEEERRHTDSIKIQRKMLYLTIVALVFATIQTGIIKIPTIYDFNDVLKKVKSHNNLINRMENTPVHN